MKTLIPILLLLAATAIAQPTGADKVPGSYTLLGTLGRSYLIRMELERTGDSFKGRYHYERSGVVRPGANDIDLTGHIDSGGSLQLTETAEVEGRAGVRTGEFNGLLTSVTIEGQTVLRLAGTWTRARDGMQLPFSLDQLRTVFGAARLTRREEREENKPLNYTIRLNLPSFGDENSNLNRHLASIVKPLAAGFRKDVTEIRREELGQRSEVPPSSFEVDYEIVSSTPELLSLQLAIYSYTGGAHPNASTRAFNWDLRREREVELAELFQSGSGYERVITGYCRRELGKLDLGSPDWIARGTAFTPENYRQWYPTRAGLRITFDPYQVAAYAQGSLEVTVPWAVLRSMIRRDGLARQFSEGAIK